MLPPQFAWLEVEPGPKMLLEAVKLYGVLEAPGEKDNPVILGWARELGLERAYSHDSVPWCALFVAVVAKRAGKPDFHRFVPGKSLLWALNWKLWGEDGGQPELGDILVFVRTFVDPKTKQLKTGGHVGFYVGEDHEAYFVLGGNQSNEVNIKRIPKSRLRACRQYFKSAKPTNVRPVFLRAGGALSDDES